MAERQDAQSFKLNSGDNVQLEFTVVDNDEVAVNLTGGSGRFAMARNVGEALAVDSDASPATATISIVDAVNGLVNVLIDDDVTDPLEGDYYYEFKWTDSSGNEAIIALGYITFYANLI